MKWWIKALLESAGFNIIDRFRKRNLSDRVDATDNEMMDKPHDASFQKSTAFDESVNDHHGDFHIESAPANGFEDNRMEPTTHLYCRKCGKEIALDSDFCCYCGAEIIHRKG